MKIVGLSGTDGSGKDTVGEVLVERFGWIFLSVTDLLREEARSRGQTLSRETLRRISEQWRRQHGPAVLVDKAIEHFSASNDKYHGGLAIASLRHPAEAKRVHELGGKVIWTDADPHVRYERVTNRRRGAEDDVTFEEFLAEEQAQMSHTGDEHTLNLSAVKDLADLVLRNEGDDVEAFKDAAEKALKPFID